MRYPGECLLRCNLRQFRTVLKDRTKQIVDVAAESVGRVGTHRPVGKIPHAWRTLIEIWDTAGSMKRLAAFPIRGSVGYRIGWSQDARRFAAIRSTGDGTDALIYAIP